ncbi:hypothetical protein O7606_00240 [Micromonospora sp. WMMD882]|uniref:hypothetical protein n=1 Tax=Micromonospora sp. WMMD882 TaxID=3015151 RepID=UPI00248B353F|nr:hypothetical protein [Micromonospora sp. WMMD882]WBB79881.1 hypothetical protein O7606_00240 [Micromonospora sp. WMMD882]
MSVTRMSFATTVRSVLATAALAAIIGFGAALTGGAGSDAPLAGGTCPQDTHWSVELGVCVADTHW